LLAVCDKTRNLQAIKQIYLAPLQHFYQIERPASATRHGFHE